MVNLKGVPLGLAELILKKSSVPQNSKGLEFSVFFNVNCCYCSVTKSCLTLCDPMDCSMPGFQVYHHLLELTQIHVH